MSGSLSRQRLLAVFLLGVVLFNYPILSVFDLPVIVGGVPLLYAFIFFAWAVVIGLLAFVIERSGR